MTGDRPATADELSTHCVQTGESVIRLEPGAVFSGIWGIATT
jgi:hypothetical protein